MFLSRKWNVFECCNLLLAFSAIATFVAKSVLTVFVVDDVKDNFGADPGKCCPAENSSVGRFCPSGLEAVKCAKTFPCMIQRMLNGLCSTTANEVKRICGICTSSFQGSGCRLTG